MAEHGVEEHFVELVSNVSHGHGVFRITLAQQEKEAQTSPRVRLLIPAAQLPRILKSISDAANEIGRQIRDQQGAAQDGVADAAAPGDAAAELEDADAKRRKK